MCISFCKHNENREISLVDLTAVDYGYYNVSADFLKTRNDGDYFLREYLSIHIF